MDELAGVAAVLATGAGLFVVAVLLTAGFSPAGEWIAADVFGWYPEFLRVEANLTQYSALAMWDALALAPRSPRCSWPSSTCGSRGTTR